jgi:hypothetical protein
MFDRLGVPGLMAGLVLVGCVFAAAYQGSVVAAVAGAVAAIYVAIRLFRPADA